MTADLHRDEEYGALHEYSGIPNKPEKQEEKGRWGRFLEWALPWLKRKQILAEALLEAKVRQEVAKAQILELRVKADALEIAALTARMELEKMEEAEFEVISEDAIVSEEDLGQDLEALEEKIKLLNLKHGTRIEIHRTHPKMRSIISVRASKGEGIPIIPDS